ncbi:MAG: DUF1848 domain-containing protein [Deltaproteobacteria bacterium]|nr:DUF1848 domain-containing protein [Deltaproteobacteria bacterium]
MIISASRRTDIPAFYSSWFMERIREGRVLVKNPFNPSQRKIVSLRPEDVDVIVFWTRNANPIQGHLKELDQRGFPYVFLYTITGYGPPLERHAPSLEEALETFKRLSQKIGPERVFWRFDPIIYISGKGEEWIAARFEKIARSLRNETARVIVSFLDFYKKVVKRLARLEEKNSLQVVDIINKKEIVRRISITLTELARRNNMKIYSCAEKVELESFGIKPGQCIDGELLNRIFGLKIRVEKDKKQRPQCRCTISQDIGEYNTCRYGCIYCYAI